MFLSFCLLFAYDQCQDVLNENMADSFNRKSFQLCKISIEETNFTNLQAIGASLRFGSGGVMFIVYSQVSLKNCRFVSSFATIGGSLYLGNSWISIFNCSFENSISKLIGGAIFVHNHIHSSDDPNFLISKCNFSKCVSRNIHGAVSVHEVSYSWIHQCNFSNCQSIYHGGALGIVDSYMTITETVFLDNRLCKMNYVEYSNKFHYCHGGAAIGLFRSKKKLDFNSDLAVSKCYFECNGYDENQTFIQNYHGYGYDVLSEGDVWIWFSNVSFSFSLNFSLGCTNEVVLVLDAIRTNERQLCSQDFLLSRAPILISFPEIKINHIQSDISLTFTSYSDSKSYSDYVMLTTIVPRPLDFPKFFDQMTTPLLKQRPESSFDLQPSDSSSGLDLTFLILLSGGIVILLVAILLVFFKNHSNSKDSLFISYRSLTVDSMGGKSKEKIISGI